MARFVALLADPTARERLCNALRQERAVGAVHDLRFAANTAELAAWCAYEDVHALVFDPFAPVAPNAEFWSTLHTRVPTVALLVYADLARHTAGYHDWLKQTGIREVVFLNEEDSPPGLRERLTRGLLLPLYGAVLPGVRERFPMHLVGYAERLLRESQRPLAVEEAVALDFRSERTLRRELEGAGLPPLGQLALWFRLLHAAHLLDDSGRTVRNVARTLCFVSENALYNQISRYVGRGAGALRRSGARECVWAAFRARCRVQ